MSQVNGDSFQRALNRFKQDLSQNLIQQFSVSTLRDVQKTCRDIQDQQGQEGGLRNMRRLRGFLEAMDQFGQVIEVFLNVHEIICFVWGPIKFLLVTTKSYIESFDKLLDVFSQIGEAVPGLQRYQAAFEKHPPLATVLEDYYSDILQFFQAAIAVFKRPKWKKLFHSTWKTFKSDLGPILDSLQKRRGLLESEKASATLYEIQDIREEINRMRDEQNQKTTRDNQEKHKERIAHIREKLQAPNYSLDQEVSMEDRSETKSGNWIFQDHRFQAWFSQNTTGDNVLYVNGIPGAGKTTLMSTVIDRLLVEKHRRGSTDCVAYFYFKSRQEDKVSHNSMLRAILDQLLRRDLSISDHLFNIISDLDGNDLRATKKLEELVKAALDIYPSSFIVLDGLDECMPEEAIRSVKWLLTLVDQNANANNATIRLLCCGQRDGNVSELLTAMPSITLEEHGHYEDVRQYCLVGCSKIKTKFKISDELEQEIFSRITDAAKGMFLYARIVLWNLLSQTKRSGLKREVEPGNFPQGLEKAYERIAIRVFDTTRPQGEDAKKVLGWIVSAKRLLWWREIQALFSIDPDQGEVDYEGEALVLSCKELCGALVDVHCTAGCKPARDDIVKIVHESAREFLIRKWLDCDDENAKLAIKCTSYLTSHPFARELSEDKVDTNVINGYYSFQEYAVQFWYDHCLDAVNAAAKLQSGTYENVVSTTHRFLESYEVLSGARNHLFEGVRNQVAQRLKKLPELAYDRNTMLNIESRTSSIRTRIESFQALTFDESIHDAFANLHDTITPFKCPKQWCSSFTNGFATEKDRNKHVNSHDLPFLCSVDDCFASNLGYDTRIKLDRHKEIHHSTSFSNGAEFPKSNIEKDFHRAVERGDLLAVKSFLDSGEDANRTRLTKGGLSPLHLAVRSGHFHVAELLCANGAITTIPNHSGVTPICTAAERGDAEMVHLLLKQSDYALVVNPFEVEFLLLKGCASGQLSVVRLLIEQGCLDVPRAYDYFAAACHSGSLELVNYLIQKHPSVSIPDSVFYGIVLAGHTAIASVLYPKHIEGLPIYELAGFSFASGSYRTFGKNWFADIAAHKNLSVELSLSCSFGGEKITNGTAVWGSQSCFSVHGGQVALAQENSFSVRDISNGEVVFRSEITSLEQLSQHHSGGSGRYVTSYSVIAGKPFIVIWDVEARTIHRVVDVSMFERPETIRSVQFSRDGRILVADMGHFRPYSTLRSGIAVWSVSNCAILQNFTVLEALKSLSLSPDGHFLAASWKGGGTKIWDLTIQHPELDMEDNIGGEKLFCVAFLPLESSFPWNDQNTGRMSWKTIMAQNVDGEAFQKLLVYGATQESYFDAESNVVSISPDNRLMLVALDPPGCVNLWNLETGCLEVSLCGHKPSGRITSLSWGPNSDTFATTDSTGVTNVWRYSCLPLIREPKE